MDMVPMAVDQESLQGFVLPSSLQTVLARPPRTFSLEGKISRRSSTICAWPDESSRVCPSSMLVMADRLFLPENNPIFAAYTMYILDRNSSRLLPAYFKITADWYEVVRRDRANGATAVLSMINFTDKLTVQ